VPIHGDAKREKPLRWRRRAHAGALSFVWAVASLGVPALSQPILAASGPERAPSLPILLAAILLAAVAMFTGFRLGRRHSHPPFTANAHDMQASLAAFRAEVSGRLDAGGALIHAEMTGIAEFRGERSEQEVLADLLPRLRRVLPSGAMLEQSGWQSILVFLPGEADPVKALSLARAISGALGQARRRDGDTAACACHCGIALAPKDGGTAEVLLRRAELALAAARAPEAPGYAFFDPDAAEAAERRRRLQQALAAAEAAQSLRLVFQPIHHMRSGQLAGFEALMRMDDPVLGPVPPSEFIPLAEQTGAISRLGAWSLDEACRCATQWPPHLVVAVNLSPAQFLGGTLVSTVRNALQKHALPAYRLEIEITEGTLMSESELVLGQLRILRDMGVGIALDDFGTGYSSLGYLWRFPFSKLKIDRSFVAALEQSASAKGVLRSIVKLGHSLGMTVTAEGIEKAKQLACLRELGCDLGQGYLLGRPAPIADLAPLMQQDETSSLPALAVRAGGRRRGHPR